MNQQKTSDAAGTGIQIGPAGKKRVDKLAVCAVFTALICLFTMFIQIRIFPTEGVMVHI